MAQSKFKLRLGSQQHFVLTGSLRHRLGDYNCRLALRCEQLQASASGVFTLKQIRDFTNSVIRIVCELRGECELKSTTASSFSIRVLVGNAGQIITDVVCNTLTSNAANALGWNAHARFETLWSEYYNPIDVEALNVATLVKQSGIAPSVLGEMT